MKLKAIAAAVLLICTAVIPAACGGEKNPGGKTDVNIEAGYMRLDLSEQTGKTEGFGTQFDTLIVEAQNFLTEEEWELWCDAAEEMNLQSVRIRFYPEMYERGKDNADPFSFDRESANVDFNSIEMNHLYKLLDLFERLDVKVDLSWYGCRTTFTPELPGKKMGKMLGSWLGGKYGENGINSWMVAPSLTDNPNEEFAESVAECLDYLINVKKYTCLYQYSIFPEPEGVIKNMDDFKAISVSIENRLAAKGLSDKIIFSGPADYNNNPSVLEDKYLSKIDFEHASSSVYKFNAQSGNEEMLDFALEFSATTAKYGLTWSIAESGTSNFLTPVTNSDSGTYDRAMFMARFMINMTNGGCTGIKYFVFGDCYYDGTLNELGLFKFSHENWAPKPVWYSWSLIAKYSEFGSDMFPIASEDENLCATALRLPDGSWSYFAANTSNSEKNIAVVNVREDKPSAMNVYMMSESGLPDDGKLLTIPSSSQLDASSGVAYVSVPANGFVVVSSKGL